MPFLNRNGNIALGKCATQTTKLNLTRHTIRYSVGTIFCAKFPNILTISQNDSSYHIAKKYSAPKFDVTFKCRVYYEECGGFTLNDTKSH